jgi:hypothetical protein
MQGSLFKSCLNVLNSLFNKGIAIVPKEQAQQMIYSIICFNTFVPLRDITGARSIHLGETGLNILDDVHAMVCLKKKIGQHPTTIG